MWPEATLLALGLFAGMAPGHGTAARSLIEWRFWVRHERAERTQGKTGLTKEEREELARLRKENRELRMERDIPKKSRGLLRQAPAATFAAIDAEKATYPIRMLCRALGVTPSGFYAWRTRPESARAQEDRRLKVLLHASYTGGRGYYGSPRIHDDFIEWGEHVSRKRIIRLKREEGLVARVRKRYKVTTDSDHDQPIADNLLRQDFSAERPNQRWVGDTSELRIGETGKAYLAVILDLYSRFVVGWAISAVNDRHLTIKALEMALSHARASQSARLCRCLDGFESLGPHGQLVPTDARLVRQTLPGRAWPAGVKGRRPVRLRFLVE